MRIWTRLSAIVLLATGVAALAQAAAPVPEKPYRMVWVVAFVADPMNDKPKPPGMIRRAKVGSDATKWLDEKDAPIAAWRQTEQEGSAVLRLDMDAAGRVSGCSAEGVSSYNPAPLAWADDLCRFVAQRAQVSPALRNDGTPMSDQVQLFILFKTKYSYGPQSGPLIQHYMPVPMMVAPGPVEQRLAKWPPTRSWLDQAARQPQFSGAVQQPDGTLWKGPLIGVEIADPQSGDPACRVVLSSGNLKLDAKACNHVSKKLKPIWADNVRFSVRRWPLLLVPTGKGFRVLTADRNLQRALSPAAGERNRLEGLWRGQVTVSQAVSINGDVSADGRAINCMVWQSSGNDVADVAACRLFVDEARFITARDVFGQAVSPARYHSWDFMPK